MSPGKAKAKRSEIDEMRRMVAAFVAAGADESVQRVITTVHRVSRRLDRWYDTQLADLGITSGEWTVLGELGRNSGSEACTPTQLATAANVAPSSMTHRLDRMVERGLISREVDPSNRTRVLVRLSDNGWKLYAHAIQDANIVESDLMADLSAAQVEELASLLERVLAGLDESDL